MIKDAQLGFRPSALGFRGYLGREGTGLPLGIRCEEKGVRGGEEIQRALQQSLAELLQRLRLHRELITRRGSHRRRLSSARLETIFHSGPPSSLSFFLLPQLYFHPKPTIVDYFNNFSYTLLDFFNSIHF